MIFVNQSFFVNINNAVKLNRNLINCFQNDLTTTSSHIVEEFQGMCSFFLILYFHPVSKTRKSHIFKISSHRQIHICRIRFGINLFIQCV